MHVANQILPGCAKQQCKSTTCKKRMSAQIPKLLEMGVCKTWNYFQHDPDSTAKKVCSQNSSKWKAMFEGDVETFIDQKNFNFWFEVFLGQSASQKSHPLCYWPTIHNLIRKICPEFQVLNSNFWSWCAYWSRWEKIASGGNVISNLCSML